MRLKYLELAVLLISRISTWMCKHERQRVQEVLRGSIPANSNVAKRLYLEREARPRVAPLRGDMRLAPGMGHAAHELR